MKVAPRQVESFLRKPDPAARAVLVYGRDAGQAHERLATLVGAVLEDPGDPFRLSSLAAAAVAKDPAILRDEAAALSFTGGRRVVRVLGASDALANAFQAFLEAPVGEALVLLEAGDLGTRSSLRRLFETSPRAAAIPCYGDEGHALESLLRESLAGFTLAPEARAYLLSHLGADRLLTRRELEKLVLYAEGKDTIALEDAVAAVGDSSALALEDAAYAAGQGQREALEEALERLHLEGASPIAILRTASQHFLRLHLVRGHMEKGKAADAAIQALRPAVFFKRRPAFHAQLTRWPLAALSRTLELLAEREAACKSSGMPAKTLCDRTLLEIAVNGGRNA